MKKKFNLIELLTVKKGEGIIVWLYNIGAEKYWNNVSSTIVNKKEDIIVNLMGELNILPCRSQDFLILHKKPDEFYLSKLVELGFKIPQFITPEEEDDTIPISELVLKDKTIKTRLREISSKDNVYFVPFSVTVLEEEIAKKCNLNLIGAPSHIAAAVNNKIFSRKLCQQIGLNTTKGILCKQIHDIKKAYITLTESYPFFQKIIIKEPCNASGKGLYIVDNKEDVEILMGRIKRLWKADNVFGWIVEGWYDKKHDINYQINISSEGEIQMFSINKQLVEGTVHRGSQIPAQIDENILNTYEGISKKVGQSLYEAGYYGIAGIDSFITEEDEMIPVLEINGRLNQSTYLSFLPFGKNKKIISFYTRMITNKPLSYEMLYKEIEKEGLEYKEIRGEGVIILTSATLPHISKGTEGNLTGRVFAIVVSDIWDRSIEIQNNFKALIEKVQNSLR